jgi:acyl-coenzyme A thioesterase PaaI-like protein
VTEEQRIPEELIRILRPDDPRRVIGRGHPVGDILEAYEWEVLERELGHLRVRAHLPATVRNPRGQLFGGFTGTYVDFMSLFTFWAGREEERAQRRPWLATLNMRVDYFRPVVGPHFEMEGRIVHLRGGTGMIDVRFFDDGPGPEGSPLVYAYTTLKAAG